MYPDQITCVLTTSIYVQKGCMCLAGAIEKLCILMNYIKKNTKWLGINPLEMSHLQQVKRQLFFIFWLLLNNYSIAFKKKHLKKIVYSNSL